MINQKLIETKQSCVRCVCKQEHGKTNSDITGVPEACRVKGQEAQSNVPGVLYLRGGGALSPRPSQPPEPRKEVGREGERDRGSSGFAAQDLPLPVRHMPSANH